MTNFPQTARNIKNYILCAILIPIYFIIGLIFAFFSPLAVCFIKRSPYTTTVKRYKKQVVTLNRDKLVPLLKWFDTHDNATDEYWYGMYDNTVNYTQEYYDTHRMYRWYCRYRWLLRNSGYGFNYWISRKYATPILSTTEYKYFTLEIRRDSFQLTGFHPFLFGKWNSVNIGWKEHDGFPKLIFAGRLIGLRDNPQK